MSYKMLLPLPRNGGNRVSPAAPEGGQGCGHDTGRLQSSISSRGGGGGGHLKA